MHLQAPISTNTTHDHTTRHYQAQFCHHAPASYDTDEHHTRSGTWALLDIFGSCEGYCAMSVTAEQARFLAFFVKVWLISKMRLAKDQPNTIENEVRHGSTQN
jgi:hypothetical protein